MSSEAHLGGDSGRDSPTDIPAACYDVLRHPRRIRILEVLGTRRTRLSLTELTTAILERESPDVSTGQARHEIRIGLVHNHLPRLAEYDLVDWDADTGAELVGEPPVHPADLGSLLDRCDDGGERLLEAIVHPVRMQVLSILGNHEQPLSVDRLASALAARDVDAPSDPEHAKIALHHSHLPMLADLGVVEFDHESGLVARRDKQLSIVR